MPMVTTEASRARCGLKARAISTSEKQEIAAACRKSARFVSWNGLTPSAYWANASECTMPASGPRRPPARHRRRKPAGRAGAPPAPAFSPPSGRYTRPARLPLRGSVRRPTPRSSGWRRRKPATSSRPIRGSSWGGWRRVRAGRGCGRLLLHERDAEVHRQHLAMVRRLDRSAHEHKTAEAVVQFDVDDQLIAGLHHALESDFADTREHRRVTPEILVGGGHLPRDHGAGRLEDRLADQHPGHDRIAGVMALEEILVRPHPAAGRHRVGAGRDDFVDKQEGRPLGNELLDGLHGNWVDGRASGELPVSPERRPGARWERAWRVFG